MRQTGEEEEEQKKKKNDTKMGFCVKLVVANKGDDLVPGGGKPIVHLRDRKTKLSCQDLLVLFRREGIIFQQPLLQVRSSGLWQAGPLCALTNFFLERWQRINRLPVKYLQGCRSHRQGNRSGQGGKGSSSSRRSKRWLDSFRCENTYFDRHRVEESWNDRCKGGSRRNTSWSCCGGRGLHQRRWQW